MQDPLNDHWHEHEPYWDLATKVMSIGILALALLAFVIWLFTPAKAHDYAHPELKKWFMGLHNQQGSPCCDGDDAVHIEDADWDTSCEDGECRYKVKLEGKWYDVPPTAVVDGPNKSGTALVWPVRYGYPAGNADYVIRCFMPGTQI